MGVHGTMRRQPTAIGLTTTFFACLAFGISSAARAEAPLHVRIDNLIDSARTGPASNECTDAEFLRRVSLDLNGIVPSAAEARAYLNDSSPDKRTALIDRLLKHPRYARHMATTLDVMLMERRKHAHIKAPPWQKYLHDSVVADKPFNQLAREILSADSSDDKQRTRSRFLLDRAAEPHAITRDVGRIFFGRDLQCAQCHDHPLIDNYLQEDYYGLFAFFQRVSLLTPKKSKKSFLSEKADGEAVFTSVFTEEKGQTLPRLPGGLEIDDPPVAAGELYKVKPTKAKAGIPQYSRRVAFAEQATDGSNRAFNRNIANRLWAHMMGRGLVHPLDLHHPDNPPAHPELLNLLGDEFAAMNFDIKSFLRELALTKVYRRSFDVPVTANQTPDSMAQRLDELQQLLKQQEAGIAKHEAEADTARDAVLSAQQAFFEAETAHKAAAVASGAARKASAKANKTLGDSQKKLATTEQAAQVLAEALAKADEVVKQLPKDKQLAAAAKTFRDKHQKAASDIAGLKKTIETQTAAAKAAEDKAAKSQQKAAQAAAKLAECKQSLVQARGPYFHKLYAYRAVQTSAAHAKTLRKNIETLTAHAQLQRELDTAKLAATTARDELNKVQTASAQAVAESETAQAQLAAPRKIHSAAQRVVEEVRSRLQAQQPLFEQVVAAKDAAEIALAALPQDADLRSSAAKLTQLAAQLERERKQLQQRLQDADNKLTDAANALQTAEQGAAAAEQKHQDLQQTTTDVQQRLEKLVAEQQAKRSLLDTTFEQLTKEQTASFSVGPLKPLTPEQLCWSMMQATGLVAQQQKKALGGLKEPEKIDAAARAQQVEAAVNKALQKHTATFVKTFGAGAGQPQQEFFGTVDQALFFANGETVLGWLNPAGDNLIGRLQSMKDSAACAEELYLAIHTRFPTQQEVADVEQYLAGQSEKERPAALKEIAWALLSSVEFRFTR